MVVKISGSVGKKGKNDSKDAEKIQKLLNVHKKTGGFSAVKVDSQVGKKTISAIEAFQKKVADVKPDGRVDPGGKTLKSLNEKPGSSNSKPGTKPGEKPGAKGGGDEEEEDEGDLYNIEVLRRLAKKVVKKPYLFAFGLAAKPEDCVLVLKKKGNPRKLSQMVKKDKGLNKVTFGIASADPKSKQTLVFDIQGKVLPGMDKKAKKFLKAKKLMPFKDTKMIVDGQPVKDAPGDEEEEESPVVETKKVSKLSGSVGKGGKNAPDDVKAVQTLLNENGAKLEADGQSGTKTVKAIGEFQKKNDLTVDGRVDPDGATWNVLNGGAAPKGQGGGSKSGVEPDEDKKKTETEKPPARDSVEDDIEKEASPKEPGGKGRPPWFDAVTEIPTPIGPVKINTDGHGNVTGGSIARDMVGPFGPTLLIPPYSFGFEIKPLEFELAFKGTGPRFPLTGSVGCGGSGFMTFGGGAKGVIVGLKGEIGLSLSTKAFTAEIDFDELSWSFAATKFPIIIPLKGEIKAGAFFEVGEDKVSHTIPIKTYDQIVIAVIKSDMSVTIKKGPGLAEIKQDLDDFAKFIEENPTAAGTGATPITPEEIENLTGDAESEEPAKAESSAADAGKRAGEGVQAEIDKRMRKEAIQTCRQIENGMHAAFQQGWQDPNLVGKANALNQQDKAQAKKIYGNAWTQRALAKQAHDKYQSPIESNPVNIIEARTAQAEDIAQKFNTAISLFHQGDASW